MEAFNHVSHMHDVALKPRLLHTLIKDHLPDEKHPFSNPSDLSRVVSTIRTHRLLAETFTDDMDQKQIERWKSAVNSWVNCILTLASSDMPDKCWAGISLLGFTCQECSSPRFLESCSKWFEKLLQFLQSPARSHFVRVSSIASMSDLFSRLSGFPNVTKDGSSFAAKVVQPVLKLLNDDNSEVIWEGALHLLCTIMTSFPFAVQRNYDSVESAIASKLLSGGCSQHLLKKLAYSLALIPKSRGDSESWFVLMQKILVIINDQLSHSFQGLEEEIRRNEFVKLLVQPGKDPPAALGSYVSAENASYKATKKSQQSSISIVSILMHCCCTMLTNSYPFKVTVPVRMLLALVDRVLMVNGSLSQMSMPFVTAKQQEDICSELPVLHSYGLELLTAVVKGVGSQLLPHAAFTARMITMYFKTCALPELRIKVYSIAKILLVSMGVGMALCLAQEVVNNAFVDLSTIRSKGPAASSLSNSNVSTIALLQPKSKKRKRKSMAGSLQYQEHGVSISAADAPKCYPATPISLRIAALEALEVLITVAGSLKSETWRSKVDNLLINIAIDSFDEGWVSEELSTFEQKESAVTSADLQLAALRALLASLLSFSRARPQHLARGLQLFQRGKQLIGTKVSEFCAYALLALEVLIHPRALPLLDYFAIRNSSGGAHSNSRDGYAIGRNKSNPFGSQQVGYDIPESDDDLCQKWLEDGTEPDVPLADVGTKQPEEPSAIPRDNDPKLLTVQNTSGTKKPKRPKRKKKIPEIASCADVEMTAVEGEIVNKSDRPGESNMQVQDPVRNKSNPFGSQQVGYDIPESDDDLCQKCLEDGTEPDVPLADVGTKQPEEPSAIPRDNDPKLLTVQNTSGTKKPKRPKRKKKIPEIASCADVEMTAVEGEIVNKSDRPGESNMQVQDPVSCASISHAEASCKPAVVESVSEKIVSDSTVPHAGNQMESSQETSINKDNESANLSNIMPMTSDLNKDQAFAPNLDHDDSSGDGDDDLPDIVDADPDSDSS